MANGDYWNRGRQQGMRTNTAMDTLERILGMGKGIAQGVQANRDKRQSFDLKMIDILSGNYETEYNSASLAKNIEAVEAYRGKKVSNMSAETIDVIDTALAQMNNQQKQNTQFKTDMSSLDSLSKRAGDWATDIYQNWELKTEKERKSLIESGAEDSFGVKYTENYYEAKKKDFLKISKDWAEAKGKMGQYDSRRLTGFHTSNMVNLETIVNGALDFYNDGTMSELEINTITNAVASGNAQPVANLMQIQAGQESNATTSTYRELDEYRKNIESYMESLENNQVLVKYKDIKNLLPEEETINTEWKDSDTYTINLDDGSVLSNRYKVKLEDDLKRTQEKLVNTDDRYEKISGQSYAEIFNLSDDFLGIETDIVEEEEKVEVPVKEALPGQDLTLLDKEEVLDSVDSEKAERYNLSERLDKLKFIDDFAKNYKFGEGFSNYKNKEVNFDSVVNFSENENLQIKKWFSKNYPKDKILIGKKDFSRAKSPMINITKELRSLLGQGEGRLTYEELKLLKNMHDEDLKRYNKAQEDLKRLVLLEQAPKNIKDYISGRKVSYGSNDPEKRSKMPEWQRLTLEIDDYGHKWLNWKVKERALGSTTYMDRNEYLDYNRTTKEEIDKQLEFYEGIIPDILKSNQNQINQVRKIFR